jgi:hypothetical protein
VLTATGEREATIAATEQGAGAALRAMITDESLTVSEAVQWCAGAISHREATQLRHPTAGPLQPGGLVLGCSCVQVVHDAKDPSALPSGWGLLAGSRRRQTHFPARSAGESVKPR